MGAVALVAGRGGYAPVPATVRVRRLVEKAPRPLTLRDRLTAQADIMRAVYGSAPTYEQTLTVARLYAARYPNGGGA
jgi:hypothetical protein